MYTMARKCYNRDKEKNIVTFLNQFLVLFVQQIRNISDGEIITNLQSIDEKYQSTDQVINY